MNWVRRRLPYLVATVIAGAAALAISFASGYWDYPLDASKRGGRIFEYQGLIGGLLALAGAIATVIFLQRQIVASRQIAERQRREAIASRNGRLVAELKELRDSVRTTESFLRKNMVFFHYPSSPRLVIGPELETIDGFRSAVGHLLRYVRLANAVSNDRTLDEAERSHRLSRLCHRGLISSFRVRRYIADLVRLLGQGWEVSELQNTLRPLEELGSPLS